MSNSFLTDAWMQHLGHYNTCYVGLSGGLDSTVLLHYLATHTPLIQKIKAIHIHHGLSVNADHWQGHCQRFCDALGVSLIVRRVQIDSSANIEEAARQARYQAFNALLDEGDGLLLAHHRDDQAETLLLQLFRGAGIDGLAAMPTVKALDKGELLRPFLEFSRADLEAYAHQHHLSWVNDESNEQHVFSRNYIRHQIMPLLQSKWPGVVGNLVRTASHCQQAKMNLDALAKLDCAELNEPRNYLSTLPLTHLDHGRLTNVLRVWLRQNQVRPPAESILKCLIDELILASEDSTPEVQWADTVVRRYQHILYVMPNEHKVSQGTLDWPLFPAPMSLDLTRSLKASLDTEGCRVPKGARIEVRFREGGESFLWHGQHKALKKLLQAWKIPPWQRDHVPLVYINGELAVVVGHAISDKFYAVGDKDLYQFKETLI